MESIFKPKIGEPYFFADYECGNRRFEPFMEIYQEEDNDEFDFPIYRTQKCCQKYCDRFNNAIKNIEP